MKGRVWPRPFQLVDGERRPIKGKSSWTYEFGVPRGGKRKFVTRVVSVPRRRQSQRSPRRSRRPAKSRAATP